MEACRRPEPHDAQVQLPFVVQSPRVRSVLDAFVTRCSRDLRTWRPRGMQLFVKSCRAGKWRLCVLDPWPPDPHTHALYTVPRSRHSMGVPRPPLELTWWLSPSGPWAQAAHPSRGWWRAEDRRLGSNSGENLEEGSLEEDAGGLLTTFGCVSHWGRRGA